MANEYLHKALQDLSGWVQSPYRLGFVRGHEYLAEREISQIRLGLNSRGGDEVVREYEHQLAALIGPGRGVSFAAGRMAFYAVLQALGVGSGDEVILPGFTCSVMPNAVWRTGARPVFADIEAETFGSGASGIVAQITSRTKAVVAQHSFGIPCNIPEIVEVCRQRGLALIEDCAITLDSAYDGRKVGNWGDAAIFSTDHSKPLNTLMGGFFYTRDEALSAKVRTTCEAAPPLSQEHQSRLFQQFLYERQYYQPENYRHRLVRQYLGALAKKLGGAGRQPVFLEKDYNKPLPNYAGAEYPYPSKMPPFLARLGLIELARWGQESLRRKELLQDYLCLTRGGGWGHYLPRAYENRQVDIVPLRFVFTHPEARKLTRRMARFIDVSWTWFRSPIICTDSSEALGYAPGSCPEAERIGPEIINWPCVIAPEWRQQLLEDYKNLLSAPV
jgi:dTDP-4-amino-4,6-dideoxygalactose transaminase